MTRGHGRPGRPAIQRLPSGEILSPTHRLDVTEQASEPVCIWRASEEVLVAGTGGEDGPHEDASVDDRPYFVLMERAIRRFVRCRR